jgi:hypothetical protein
MGFSSFYRSPCPSPGPYILRRAWGKRQMVLYLGLLASGIGLLLLLSCSWCPIKPQPLPDVSVASWLNRQVLLSAATEPSLVEPSPSFFGMPGLAEAPVRLGISALWPSPRGPSKGVLNEGSAFLGSPF